MPWRKPRRYASRIRYRNNRRTSRAASRIGRAWRRYKARKTNKTYRSARSKTSNVSLSRTRTRRLTLAKRVQRLEISAKKHYDYVNSRPVGQPINRVGVSDGTLTNESFSDMLAIQPRQGDGTIPPASGSSRGTERNTREGMEVFCTQVRLRGRILGIRPADAAATAACMYGFTDPVSGTDHFNYPQDRASSIRAACQSRVHILVLQDKRPSTIDATTGIYQPNPLPQQPMNPLQGLMVEEGLTANNTLQTLGLDSCLRNYTNNRFKIVHSSTLQFDWLHPSKWFDIKIKVNKKLVYPPPDPAVVPQVAVDPVNYNLLVYFVAVPSEISYAESPQFVMNNVEGPQPNPTNLLLSPNLQMLSARTYFRET